MRDKKYFRGKAVIDEELNIRTADEKFNAFLGNNVIYKLARSVHPNDMRHLELSMESAYKGESSFCALRMVNAEGAYQWMLVMLQGCEESVRGQKLIDIELQDIGNYQEAIQELRGSNERYMEYFSLMEHLLCSYDVSTGKLRIFMTGSHQQVNFYSGTLENWKLAKLINKDVDSKCIHVFEHLCEDFATGAVSFEHELKMSMFEDNKKQEWCLIKGKTIEDIYGKKHVIASMSMVNPVSNQLKSENSIIGAKDVGADILNKRAITSYAQRLLESKPDYNVTIAVIDIDNFKGVNDQYGHMFGDEVIKNVADIIKSAVEGKGVAGRIGGDEMMVVIEKINTDEELRSVLRTIRNNVAWLYNNCDDKPNVTCSIGSATYPTDAEKYDELFNIADKMLYLAKEKGRNRYVIYHSDMHGDYINGKGTAKIDDYVLYKYRKTDMVNAIINDYCKYGVDSIAESVKKIMHAFNLSSIFAHDKQADGTWKRSVVGGENVPEEKRDYISSENYLVDFTQEGIKVIDNVSFFERRSKIAFEELSELGICQAIQYIVKDYEPGERIISFNRNVQMSKWSDTDIMHLTILGNIIGMGYKNDK